ncbi:MAG: 4-(cytidine 5'-diphospho)-2-C-methyl-D-erythritol kinase [Gammaproteobacteria bacterium]|jgi:4-diphosphocytidyl-2-C-methyl-D-erythritol kinase
MADQSLTLPSPAKLNLMLHIVGQRPDGYHNLQTVFQFLSIGDTLSFELAKEITLKSDLENVATEDNLIYKAAQLLKQTTGCNKGAHIQLVKRIPMGSGLGGGSSNAATTLIALNRLWHTNLSKTQLLTLARQLGADVGIFIYGHAAFAEGIGDEFTQVNPPESWYVVLVPPVHVSTVAIYRHPHLIRNTPLIKSEDYLRYLGENDFSPLVCQEYPEIKTALDWLKQFGQAYLTGSGAGLYLPCESKAQAQDIVGQIPSGMLGFAAQGQNQSSLIF